MSVVDNVLKRSFDSVDGFSSVRIDFLSNITVGQTLYVRNWDPGHRLAPKPCNKPSEDQDHAPCKPRPSTTDRSKKISSKFYNIAWPYSIHLEDGHYNLYCMWKMYVFGTPSGVSRWSCNIRRVKVRIPML